MGGLGEKKNSLKSYSSSMSTHLQTPPITCGIMSWDDSIFQAGNTDQIPSKVHIEQGRPSPKQVIQTYFPNPRQEAPCQLPIPPLCLNTQHPPVLPPAPEHVQPAPRVGRKSVMPPANGPWQLVGKCLMPPHVILPPRVLRQIPHWNMQRPSFLPTPSHGPPL